MGWIVFVIVMLVVLSSIRGKATRTRKRMMQQPTLLQGTPPASAAPTAVGQPGPSAPSAPPGWGMASGQPGWGVPAGQQQSTQPNAQAQFNQSIKLLRSILSGTLPPGTAPMSQPGGSATYRPGNSPVYSPGNAGVYRPGDAPTYAPGDSATYAPGDSPTYAPGNSTVYGGPATYAPGDSPTYAPGDSVTYAPAGAVGSRPVITPPAPQPPPPAQTAPQDYDGGFQPTYATLTELRTARRDQAVIDRDQRRESRISPEQAPRQGSTAVSSTSLNTTLATPYQPSSLMTSLSSSLSSSLMDAPPRAASTAAFADIAVVSLPYDVAEQVRIHLRNGHEVEAVRVVCDTMNVGLLEATKTVRSYA
jgi:hypothetical protein